MTGGPDFLGQSQHIPCRCDHRRVPVQFGLKLDGLEQNRHAPPYHIRDGLKRAIKINAVPRIDASLNRNVFDLTLKATDAMSNVSRRRSGNTTCHEWQSLLKPPRTSGREATLLDNAEFKRDRAFC
jgi:hypothetical protein